MVPGTKDVDGGATIAPSEHGGLKSRLARVADDGGVVGQARGAGAIFDGARKRGGGALRSKGGRVGERLPRE